jgi:hypothetical protein
MNNIRTLSLMKSAVDPEIPNKYPGSPRQIKVWTNWKEKKCKSCSLWEPNSYNIQIKFAYISVNAENEMWKYFPKISFMIL